MGRSGKMENWWGCEECCKMEGNLICVCVHKHHTRFSCHKLTWKIQQNFQFGTQSERKNEEIELHAASASVILPCTWNWVRFFSLISFIHISIMSSKHPTSLVMKLSKFLRLRATEQSSFEHWNGNCFARRQFGAWNRKSSEWNKEERKVHKSLSPPPSKHSILECKQFNFLFFFVKVKSSGNFTFIDVSILRRTTPTLLPKHSREKRKYYDKECFSFLTSSETRTRTLAA